MIIFHDLPISHWAIPGLFATGIVAGFVDSIAGGGGLITLPVLLSTGLPPQYALGTNKLQATFGSGTAAWHYRQSKVVEFSDCGMGVACTAIGAAAGTVLVQALSREFLERIIPVMLLALVAYVIFRPKLGEADVHPRMSARRFYIFAGLGLGFYDGFLGPGTGSFWMLAFMLGLGFNMTKATGYTKVMNFASNAVSLACFSLAGHVNIIAGLLMGAGQLLGARMGSRMVVTRGVKFIRPVFITMVLAVTLKLAYGAYGGGK